MLDDGAIVERGSHEELLAQGRLYAALVQSQLQIEESDSALPRLRPEQQDRDICAYCGVSVPWQRYAS